MITTLEVIYENGIFKPISVVPKSFKEHERLRIVVETEFDGDLEIEIAQWEAASDDDFMKFEQSLAKI